MKSLLICAFSFFLLPFYAAAESQEVTSQIREVTVFLKGAQVTRQARVSLQKGTTTLAFRELPLNIDPQSIQARGEGNFVILSLLHQVNYLASQRKSAQVEVLQDSLKFYEEQFAFNSGMQSVMKNEEELLIANRSIGGDTKGVLMTELKTAADFYRSGSQRSRKNSSNLTVKEPGSVKRSNRSATS